MCLRWISIYLKSIHQNLKPQPRRMKSQHFLHLSVKRQHRISCRLLFGSLQVSQALRCQWR